jgi:hypothetical protein
LLPILRAALPDVTVASWVGDVDHRTFPLLLVRQVGGERSEILPQKLIFPLVELSAHTRSDLVDTEKLYERAWMALDTARQQQAVTPAGWIHSLEGAVSTQSIPVFTDSWRVQGVIRFGLRPTNPTT